MKAIRIHDRGGPEHLVYEEAPQPHPGPGEVLVRVYATGVIASELRWDETYETKAGSKLVLPIPGRDLSGVVEEVGPGTPILTKGSQVYAMMDYGRDGAEAEFTIALPSELAPKPRTLDYVQAAAVPLTALTAWQALFDHASLVAGQTVLIHGAAGGVGVFAVQLAHWAGAHVIATASAHNRDFLHELGANEVIDYTTTRFEDGVHDVDLVFDTVGGDTLQRSWQVIKPGGVLVTIVSPQPSFEKAKAHGIHPFWFIVEPNRDELIQVGTLIDSGHLRPIIDTVFPLSQARQAYEQGARGHTRGKIVLRVVD
ncbi:NADPH:quinone reductase [Reticulibacter mediterranei]|uniref:NADPH:quinone reductase n=1 Tax=Reticulibacter mediterranei TaxID=2778369 RepID=A0A8J3MXU5_9CHLR|nr:NADP-dependent oxidoreductase [Reticulibacter mediterranei]GHO90202.1 NADPH:quinone reductase [Reticulibacter mediterranei]